MKLLFVLGILLLCITASANVIYKTVKEDGTVVYTDVPTNGATSVNLSAVNSAVIPTLGNSNQSAQTVQPINKPEKKIKYLVNILKPSAEQTIRNNAGEVSVKAQVTPKITGMFKLFLNNQFVSSNSNGAFTLENLNRGAHNIEVKFFNKSGKILASSEVQTFYLHKTSVLITPN
ncbi:DUF4124 domain-containing protein [Paraglaciecola sp. 2405UD69-4]|uniref:DUF4124 domain-containing protein n=1 Tax=Paraglaciecola sp. 2405UD69-4 TaxID=3391836 RepID=UPI0039C93CD5